MRPDFNRAIRIDFQGAKITSDLGFLLVRGIDERFQIIGPRQDGLEDLRSPSHTKHSLVQMVRQRVYQMVAGYEDCHDADYLRIDPALRLAIAKDQQVGASQSRLSRLENDVLGNAGGLEALDDAMTRGTDTRLRRKNTKRLIIDLDSTEDPAHGKQKGVAYNGHFAQNCFHPLFCFSSEGDCLRAKLRPGNVHAAAGALVIRPMVERYRAWFTLFWFRGDAAFAKPETYEYCEEQRLTSFIRLPANENLAKLVAPHLGRPVGRPPKSGIQVKIVDLCYQAKSWSRPRRVVAKSEWHRGELFPRIGFVVTSSRLPAGKVTKVYNGRGMWKTGSRKARTPCIGTRPVASGSRLTRPGCRWEFWPTISST
uniref:IS1380 family transposase n=1 Tax=Desulfobacca acetoxidans TaxID=60893 RepID=A0A7C3WQ09_9BACT